MNVLMFQSLNFHNEGNQIYKHFNSIIYKLNWYILILFVLKQDESEMVTINGHHGHQDVPKNDEKNLLKACAHHLSVSLLILLV